MDFARRILTSDVKLNDSPPRYWLAQSDFLELQWAGRGKWRRYDSHLLRNRAVARRVFILKIAKRETDFGGALVASGIPNLTPEEEFR